MSWAEHTVEIDAPVETAFDAITDYESFPRWQDAVDSVEVMSRTGDGLGEDVHLFVDAKIRKIDYVLRYSYVRPTEIRWDFVEGNGMRDVDGVYTLESLGPDRSRATYKLGADPEVPVPGMILRRTHKQLVKRSVEDLKAEAERRHRSGESPSAGAASATGDTEPHRDLGGSPYDELAGARSEPESAEPATSAGSDDWVPMAERVGASRGASGPSSEAGPSAGAPRPSGKGSSSRSHADLAGDLAGRVAETGRDVAEGALRAGREAVEGAAGVAAGVLRRVNRRLGRD